MTGRPREPAPPGVPTGPRLFLLRQVLQGRVRWLINASEAWLITDNGSAECTGLFTELVRSGWARVIPWDMAEATPAVAETETTTAGEDVLIEARRKAGR